MADDLISPEPVDPPLTGPERDMLEGWLEFHRVTLLSKCDGLGDEQRKHRPIATSLMSLHGLVRHMAEVERNWFQRTLERRPDLPAIFLSDQVEDADWAPLGDADWAADLGVWQAECERSRRVAAARGLDDTGIGKRGGQPVECSLRWIYNHMIEGHADLIRELVDNTFGR